MTITTYRIVQTHHAEFAFDGEGSRKYGGRWNHPGFPMVYTSCNTALAQLEILVHLEDESALYGYLLFPIEIQDSLINEIARNDLPKNWDHDNDFTVSRDIGTQWIQDNASVGLLVPTVLNPIDKNLLLNPHHENFSKINFLDPITLNFDERLTK